MTTLRYYIIVTFTGAVIMALEIISSRILAPEFGNSVYVWGSIISVFLAALSVGYYIGGRLADRQPRLQTLGRVLCGAAFFQVLVIFFGTQWTASIGNLTAGSPLGTLIAATLLFGPPSLLLATVSPFIVRLAARDLKELGNTAGKLYALSTGGSLVGTLACTFMLIPLLEVHRILGLLLLLTLAVAVLSLVGAIPRERVFSIFALVLAVVAIKAMIGVRHLPSDVLHYEVTPYQTLQVTERDGQRFLYGDRELYSAVSLEDKQASHIYQRYPAAALLLKPDIESMAIFGMGSGGMGTYIRNSVPELELDYVEIDPAVAKLARQYFFFREDVRTRVHLKDARQFLRTADRRWDFILANAYIGLSVPFHLTTLEFFGEVKEHLTTGGVLGINLPTGLENPFSRAIFHTLTTEFATVLAFGVRGAQNVFLMATDHNLPMPKQEMMRLARELDKELDFDPPLLEIASVRLEVVLDPAETVLLSDAYAPANYLVAAGTMPESLKR